MRKASWLLTLLLAVLWIPGTVAAQQGVISGRVVEELTQEPLADVQVVVEGTNRGSLTGPDGRYRLEDIPAGTYRVRASRIGYNGVTQQVSVAAGGTAIANFSLETAAVSLDAVVVTATGEQRKRELANAVANINADQVVGEAPVSSLSELITGRAAGVSILRSSGTTGTNNRIRIRGATSLSLDNDPIVVVDGARVNNSSDNFSIGVGGQTLGALNSINPESIESIEIIKGPSAATLYGTDAANGVILITTKGGGSAGGPRWNVYVEQGQLRNVTDYPLNYAGLVPGAPSDPDLLESDDFCLAVEVGLGACEIGTLVAYQPLNDPAVSPFGEGGRAQYGVNVAGGGDAISYFFSAEYENEVGVYELSDTARATLLATRDEIRDSRETPNSLKTVNLRANMGADLAENLRLSVNTGYITTETFFPPNDNNALGILPSGLLGSPFKNNGNLGYGFLLPEEVFAQEVVQDLARLIGSANLNWTPTEWFTGRATFGLDNTARHDQYFAPVGQVPLGTTFLGSRTSNRVQTFVYTVDGGGTASFQLTPDISSRSSAGVQYIREFVQGTFASGEELGPGAETVGAAANQFADEGTTESITLGTYLEQQFGWKERLFVTGGLRFDDNSAFGQEFDLITYPKIGVSFVVLDEQGEPFFNVLNSLRLRGAWGAAGRAPGATDALTFFNPVTATIAGRDVPAITFGDLGNPDLKPERSQEVELGFDAGLLDGRLGLEFTYYDKQTDDLLVERPLPPSLGVSTDRFDNLGSVENKGWEIAANAVPISISNVQWDIGVTMARNENKLLELGLEADSILFSPQRFQEGYPLGGYFGKEVTFEDADNDGIITPGEYELADSATFIGPAFPETQASIHSSLTLFDLVRIGGLMDYRGDFFLYNFTEEFRCRFAICQGLNDPDAPLFEQARGLQTLLERGNRSAEPYVEDASFWKLREVSVTFMIPDQWAERIGSSNASLVFAGRNLATWTDYTGADPEINSVATANFSSQEFLTQPPVRTLTVRLNLGF